MQDAPDVGFGITETDNRNPKGFKRLAGQHATTYKDEAVEKAHTGVHSSSSSTAPPPAQPVAAGSHPSAVGRESGDPTRKRQAEVPTEDLDDGMNGEAGFIDIMSIHVGPAYIANPDGVSARYTLHPG